MSEIKPQKLKHGGSGCFASDEARRKILKLRASVPPCLILLICITSIFGSAEAQDTQAPIIDPRFGTIEAYHAPELATEARVGWERIIFYWSEIERRGPDDWNWFHAPNERINAEIAAGREVIGLIAHTPDWATDGVIGAGVPHGLYLPINDPQNYWAQYVRYLVTVYGDRVHRWIIWNEPDIALDTFGAQWQGTTADYYQLVKVASQVAHEVDPNVTIHLGGLTYWHNPVYLREFLTAASADPSAAANGYYFDVVSVHVYFKPETTIDIVNSLRDQMAEFGIEKSIWINETNAPPFDDPAQAWTEPVYQVTQDEQALFLLQEVALALSLGVERIGVYKWVDEPQPAAGFEPYGVIRFDRTPRPAYAAYQVITEHYAGTVSASRHDGDEVWLVALDRSEATTRVIWARKPYPTFVLIPALAGSAIRVDQTGETREIRPFLGHYVFELEPARCEPECLMGGSPIVLVEQASMGAASQIAPRFALDLTPNTTHALIGVVVLTVIGIVGLFWLKTRFRR